MGRKPSPKSNGSDSKKARIGKAAVPKKSNPSNAASGQSSGGQKSPQAQVQPAPEPENTLTVDGSPYAPVSLKKMTDAGHFNNKDAGTEPEKSLYVIIPCENGFQADDPNVVNVMIADRVMQTTYFVDEIFPTLPRIPAYLYRYISWVMFEDCKKPMKYPKDNDFIQAFNSQILTKEDPEYKRIESFIKYAKSNTEATHLIGLLQLVGGSLLGAAKRNTGIRMFIELPETGFHPKRERLLVSLLYQLKEDYGIKADWTHT